MLQGGLACLSLGRSSELRWQGRWQESVRHARRCGNYHRSRGIYISLCLNIHVHARCWQRRHCYISLFMPAWIHEQENALNKSYPVSAVNYYVRYLQSFYASLVLLFRFCSSLWWLRKCFKLIKESILDLGCGMTKGIIFSFRPFLLDSKRNLM